MKQDLHYDMKVRIMGEEWYGTISVYHPLCDTGLCGL